MNLRSLGLAAIVAGSSTIARAREAEGATPVVYAAGTCAAASKPGRIRCRASIELPLEAQSVRRLAWGELLTVASQGDVVPLRGRLGPLDAEAHDDARIAWTFSLAAQSAGDHAVTVHARARVVDRSSGVATAADATIVLSIHVGQ